MVLTNERKPRFYKLCRHGSDSKTDFLVDRHTAGRFLLLVTSVASLPAFGVRVKDIASLNGARPNQLIGFSLIVGLNGTGDTENSLLSRRPLINALERLGVVLNPEDIRGRSVAAVMVTANLPAFAKQGTKIDVVISSLGDALTLQGGMLVMTPLRAANRDVYAVAQGLVEDVPKGIELPASQALTGFARLDVDPYLSVSPTIARIQNGGLIEKEVDLALNARTRIYMVLREPDFTTSYRLASAINREFGASTAKAEDPGRVEISIPQTYLSQTVEFVSKVENLEIETQTTAKVVIDERTGTVVLGENVLISPVAISYKNLNLVIRDEGTFPQTAYTKEQLQREYNPPINQNQNQNNLGQAAQQQNQPYQGLPLPNQEKNNVLYFSGGVDLKEIVNGLNRIGFTNRDLIDIIKNIKAAGAMKADLVIR